MVLVPSLEMESAAVARRVWELANATGSQVLFLGLCSEASQEPRIRRELVTLSAMVKDDRVFAEVVVLFGKDWADVVRTLFQAGDTVVCFAGQSAGSLRKPLSQILQSNLNIPVYVLSGLYPLKEPRPGWPSQIAAWGGSLAIIASFFMLQAGIGDLTKNWINTALLLLSIPIETWAILFWNSLFE
jgi:hypothetical protein